MSQEGDLTLDADGSNDGAYTVEDPASADEGRRAKRPVSSVYCLSFFDLADLFIPILHKGRPGKEEIDIGAVVVLPHGTMVSL